MTKTEVQTIAQVEDKEQEIRELQEQNHELKNIVEVQKSNTQIVEKIEDENSSLIRKYQELKQTSELHVDELHVRLKKVDEEKNKLIQEIEINQQKQ